MDRISEGFSLHETIQMIGQGLQGVICHVFFDAALHGLAIAVLFAIIGVALLKSRPKIGKPFIAVGKRLSIFCAVLMVPGLISLAVAGHLPSTGVFEVNHLGFIIFWSLICVHLSAEEMNHQWF
jgi:hypothetical protein